MFQSTHPHGVRPTIRKACFVPLRFNPRTHTGCDIYDMMDKLDGIKFQSTHPHGVRLASPKTRRAGSSRFNPRTHTGCDYNREICHIRIRVSIHAPTRGATQCYSRSMLAHTRFNPRTHTGCDPTQNGKIYYWLLVSIHAPTRGATPVPKQGEQDHHVSIHAPTRGATTTGKYATYV